jgi:hypothetical protein
MERLPSDQASVFYYFSVGFWDKSNPLRVIKSTFATGARAPFNVATVTAKRMVLGLDSE